ncbi:MAG: oligosaccharide flippase family protein [Bacteroidales bacterium]
MLKQKFILSYASKMVVQFVTIATSIIVARIVGPSVMGTIAWALAYVQMFGFIADLGLGTAHIKLISEGREPSKCMGTYTVLKFSASGLYLIVFMGNYLLKKFVFHDPFESQVHEYVLFISLAYMMIQDSLNIAIATFAGKTEQAKQDIPYMIQNVFGQFLRVAIVLLGGRAIALAFGNLVSGIVILPMYIMMMRNYKFGKFDKELAKEYIKIAAPVLILGAATTLTNTIDKVMLQSLTDSEQVGYYTAGQRIGGFILLISRSMSLLFFPMFSAAVVKGDFNFIQEKIYKFERFSFLFILPFVVLIALYSRDIVMILLGPEYMPSINMMSISTVALFLTVFNTPQGNVMTGLGKFRLVAIIAVVNLAIYAVLIYVFVSKDFLNYGGEGVSWCLLITNVLIGVFYRYFCYKASKLLSNRLAIQFIIYGIINFALFWLIFKNYFIDKVILRIVFLPIYLLLTYGSFYLFKWMNMNDVYQLLGLFNVKAMKNYISGEMKNKK